MKGFILLLSFCFSQVVFAQGAKELLAIANSGKAPPGPFYYEIPFENRLGYIIIPVTIGNETYDYIFDTGGYNSVTSEIRRKNPLEDTLKTEVGSSNQIKQTVVIGILPSLKIGELEFKDVGVFNFDFDSSPAIGCYTNGGLIGKGIIKEAVWQIDREAGLIRVSDQLESMPNLEQAQKVKVRLDAVQNPFIKAKINGKTDEFLLDFGFGGFISLTEKTGLKIIEANVVKMEGEGSIGAHGVSNDPIYYGPLEDFSIGDLELKKQVALYSKPNNMDLIGSEISKYFILTLNFKEKELYLTSYNGVNESPFRNFGFDINRDSAGVYVNRIHSGLAADREGLKLRDRVLSINGESPINDEYCEFYFTSRGALKQDTIRIEINRNGEAIQMNFLNTEVFPDQD